MSRLLKHMPGEDPGHAEHIGFRGIPLPVVQSAGEEHVRGKPLMTLGLLAGWDLDDVNQRANEVAAYVASCPGATPELPGHLRAPFRASLPG